MADLFPMANEQEQAAAVRRLDEKRDHPWRPTVDCLKVAEDALDRAYAALTGEDDLPLVTQEAVETARTVIGKLRSGEQRSSPSPRRYTLYRLNTGRMVGGWNVAGDDGPPDAILGMPVETVGVVETGAK